MAEINTIMLMICLLSIAVVLFCTPILIAYLKHTKTREFPNNGSSNEVPTPSMGGLGFIPVLMSDNRKLKKWLKRKSRDNYLLEPFIK